MDATLLGYANEDLEIAIDDAKRHDRRGMGVCSVCKTKVGRVDVSFTAATNTFVLTTPHGVNVKVLADGKQADVAHVLANLYVVTT